MTLNLVNVCSNQIDHKLMISSAESLANRNPPLALSFDDKEPAIMKSLSRVMMKTFSTNFVITYETYSKNPQMIFTGSQFELKTSNLMETFKVMSNAMMDTCYFSEISMKKMPKDVSDKFAYFFTTLINDKYKIKKIDLDDVQFDYSLFKRIPDEMSKNFHLEEFIFKRDPIEFKSYMIDFFLECNKEWKPELHKSLHPYVKSVLFTFAMCLKKCNASLPKVLLTIIIQFVDRRSYLEVVKSQTYTKDLKNRY